MIEENKIQEGNNIQEGNKIQEGSKMQEEKPANATETKTEYAVRPDHRHHRRLAFSDRDNMLVARNWLNIGFMLFALVGVILWTQMDDRTIATILLIIGVVLKIAEVCIRMFKK